MTRFTFASLMMCVVVYALLAPRPALAIGFIEFESSGFLKHSKNRADTTNTLSLGPQVSGTGPILQGELDVQASVQFKDKSSFTVEAPNAFVATSPELMRLHQFSFGRRMYDWSVVDDVWQMGMFSPRFIWDPTRPQKVGLLGAFYKYQTGHMRLLAYASPVSIPERGFPQREENGQIVSSSSFYNPQYSRVVIAKTAAPIVYTIDYPPMKDLLLNPNGLVSLRFQTEDKTGFWLQGLYGYMPIHQVDLAIEAYYRLQRDVVEVTVHPRILKRHLLSVEAGYKSERVSTWISGTREIPYQKPIGANWAANQTQPASIVSVGAQTFVGNLRIDGSYIFINEKDPPPVDESQFSVELPGRFEYGRAARFGAQYQGTEKMSYGLAWIWDISKRSHMYTAGANYAILTGKRNLNVNIATDFFSSSTGKGRIGQFRGNDRVRGGIEYEF